MKIIDLKTPAVAISLNAQLRHNTGVDPGHSLRTILKIVSTLMTLFLGVGAVASVASNEVKPPFPLLGSIRPRTAREIASSNWSIGGETIDRDFAVYANYRKYLGPLGAKGIRLQAGWAKCEKHQGAYEWAWLDDIVNDALAQGVQPWLETSYGNPIYEGGGGTNLGGGFPASPAALAAWDNWVRALVQRYRDRVHEWEIWNEPDGNKANTPEAYVALFIRTAQLIRAEQPSSRIYALALAGNVKYAEEFLRLLKEAGKTDLMDALTFHGYPRNPDDTRTADAIRQMLATYAPHATARQGESGAPSKFQESFALSKMEWSETTQAKWDLRRMLAHRAKDVPFNLFSMIDMHYTRSGKSQMNYKGLLESNPDQTVNHEKPSYFAAQRVFAIYDDTLGRIADFSYETSAEQIAAFGCRRVEGGGVVTAVWSRAAPPVDSNATTPIDLKFLKVKFAEPVYADLLSGKVYSIPADKWSSDDSAMTFKQIPVYDSPVLIAERAALPLEVAR